MPVPCRFPLAGRGRHSCGDQRQHRRPSSCTWLVQRRPKRGAPGALSVDAERACPVSPPDALRHASAARLLPRTQGPVEPFRAPAPCNIESWPRWAELVVGGAAQCSSLARWVCRGWPNPCGPAPWLACERRCLAAAAHETPRFCGAAAPGGALEAAQRRSSGCSPWSRRQDLLA